MKHLGEKRRKLSIITGISLLILASAAAQTGLTLYDDSNLDLNQNNITDPAYINNFFDQDRCESDEAVKSLYPNGSYACNSISSTTEAENLSETLSAGNSAGDNNINLSGNNLTEVETLNSDGSELGIGGSLHQEFGNATLEGNYSTSGNAFDVSVSGGFAYVADNLGGLKVIDVSDPSDPVLEGSYSTSGSAQGVSVSGGFAYVADRGGGLRVVDVGNRSDPVLEGSYSTSGYALGVSVSGGFAYVTEISDGLKVVDVSDPNNPVLVGSYNTPGDAQDVSVSGGFAYVTDASLTDPSAIGLNVVDVTSVDAPTASIGNVEAGDLRVTDDAIIGQDLKVQSGLNVGPRGIKSDGGIFVNGNVTADNFISSGADLAEVYSAERDYSVGTVVSVSSGESDVEATDERFEDVAGVVSTDPGIVLNREASGIEVALEGRVPVKVSEPVEKGEDVAAGSDGRAVACETSDVSLSEDSTKEEIIDAVNSLSSNQDCLKASFGTALNSSSGGYVEVKLD